MSTRPAVGACASTRKPTAPSASANRALYSSFVAETEPPPGSDSPVGDLALTMTFDELRGYEQERYDAYLPGCYAGEKHEQPVKGCLGSLASHAEAWVARNRDFLAHASGDWYRVVRMMRELATRYGKDPAE